jgi:hypothetical protein
MVAFECATNNSKADHVVMLHINTNKSMCAQMGQCGRIERMTCNSVRLGIGNDNNQRQKNGGEMARATQGHDAHTPHGKTSTCHAHASAYARTTNKQSTQTVKKIGTSHSHVAEVAVALRNVGVLFAQHLDHDTQRLFVKLDGLVKLALVLVPAEGAPQRANHTRISTSAP